MALCRELDIASQGDTLEGARVNLIEALILFFDTADFAEVGQRLHAEPYGRLPSRDASKRLRLDYGPAGAKFAVSFYRADAFSAVAAIPFQNSSISSSVLSLVSGTKNHVKMA